MDIDELKIFLYGLPLDSQESTLRDFLEAVVNYPGGVTQVNIPSKKKFAFVTVSHTAVAKSLLRSTLLYCDGVGQLYHLKACPYVKQPLKQKESQEFKPKTKVNVTVVRECKPARYTPPDHVHQFTPDYSMLSLSKPKRKRKRDESAIWFTGINGTTSSRKKPQHKKKNKKQISKLDYHKSESFQFGLLCPQRKCAISNVENTTDFTEVVDPGVHEKDQTLKKADEADVAVQLQETHEDDHRATKYSSPISSRTQVIIDHEYLGPLCLQFTSPPSIGDVKNEVMERTGLPVKHQILYNNGRKLCDSLNLRSLLDGDLESVSLLLSAGFLKGGVPPKRESEEGAAEDKEIPHSSQEEEGATGCRDDQLSQEARPLMETWDVKTTAVWLSQIGLIKKYGDICEKENINGRALLLLASKSPDKLVSIFQLKIGPETILIDSLKQHLKTFDKDKPQTMWNSKTLAAWTEKDVCNWLKELHIPEACLKVAEEEEINGQAFSLLRKSGNLKNVLQLKEGSWVVLEHELSLHLEHTKMVESGKLSADKTSLSLPEDDSKEVEKSKAPFAANDPSVRSDFETPKKVSLSREEERLSLLQSALKLDITVSKGSEKHNECVVRSIFVKRGKAANALEKMFSFIVITKEEMTGDKPRRLWSKITSKTADWLKLLSGTDPQLFLPDGGSHSFVHRPTGEKVSLREDGKVGQSFLEKLSDNEYMESQFVVLVDKQLFEEKKTLYNFGFDKKHKYSYKIKLNVKESKYHASFDANSPGQDFKWSKHILPLMNKNDDLKEIVLDPHSEELKWLSTNALLHKQAPRPFTSEFGGKWYLERSVLDSWETGSKDLINPAREFKLLRGGGTNAEDDCIKKFVYETLRFACGCLNERTNGTIHFGVADEVGDQACGYKPKEIVGSSVPNKPRYNEKLTEFIDKCFVGESRSNVHNCIRPPVFIPVRASAAEQHPENKVVIEVDIEPRYSLCAGEIFKVGFTCLDRGREKEAAYVRHGSQTVAILGANEMEVYIKRRPKLDEERRKREQETNIFQGMEKQDSIKFLHDKLKRLLCANKKVLDSSVYPILVLSKPEARMNHDFLETMFHFIQNVKWQVIIDFDDQASDTSGLCSVYKSGPDAAPCDVHEAEDYDGDDNLIESVDTKTHWIFGNGYAKLRKEAVGFKQWNNSRRKRGLSLVIQSLAKKIPFARAVVLFLLFSKDYETLADTFKDFCTYLDGPNQLAYVAENPEIVKDWESKLSSTCLEEHELRERGVVGMSWSEFRECMQQMISGIDRHQRYVIMASGSPYPLKNACFSSIEIVSAKECEELRSLSSSERLQISRKEELDFYRGYSVTWRNFWFTDDRKNHVLRRDNYSQLKALIQKIHSRGHEGKVQTVTIYHHIGAGASTMARQALWDFRCNGKFPYRCAVVTKVDNATCEELLLLRKIGYEDNSNFSSCPPVLALVEDVDDFLFREFRSQVVELAYKL